MDVTYCCWVQAFVDVVVLSVDAGMELCPLLKSRGDNVQGSYMNRLVSARIIRRSIMVVSYSDISLRLAHTWVTDVFKRTPNTMRIP